MHTILIIFHVIICLLLIAIVLLQTGRGAEIGAAFGGASRTLFGATGATTVMGKVTAVIAVLFMANCLILTYYSGHPVSKSVMDRPAKEQTTPTLPAAKPVNVVVPSNSDKQTPKQSAAATDQPTKESSSSEKTGSQNSKQ
ncbi:MAG: preprotein translocase subunit SecG [Deltaproteobacteria bacterium]|nr:preprotein translocase subunit SecG [Deltaproteobacteria bacterium]MBW2067791.1 preprotein translocase subunit SecG [Deltaproteobacteria bacterium]